MARPHTPSSEKSQTRIEFAPRRLASAVLAIGVSCSVLLATREAENARLVERQRFAGISDRVLRDFEVTLRDQHFLVESIKSTFLVSEVVDAAEFATLAEALVVNRRFSSVGAIGSFVLSAESPPDGDPEASDRIGFGHFAHPDGSWLVQSDVERNDALHAAIREAARAGRSATTAPVRIAGKLCVVWLEPLSTPRDGAAVAKRHAGRWIYAVVSAQQLLNRLARRSDPSAVFRVVDAHHGVVLAEPSQRGRFGEALRNVRLLNIGELQWRLTIEPSINFVREPSHAIVTLVIGTGLAVVVAAYVRALMTARRRAESLVEERTQELAQSEAELLEVAERKELALAGGGLGLWDWFVQANQVIYDRRTMQIIGESVGSLGPSIDGFKERLHPEDVDQVFQNVQQHFRDPGVAYSVVFRMRHRDGTYRWVHSRGRVTERDANGEVVRMTGTHVDVTETRQLETRLAQARKLESIGQLAAGIAHEINTPMQAVASNLEFATMSYERVFQLVSDLCTTFDSSAKGWNERRDEVRRLIEESRFEWLRSQAPDALADATDASRRVVEIVRAMRMMAHPGQRTKSDADVNAIVRNASTISRNRWKYCAELEHDLDADAPTVPALESPLGQVVLNLIVNAADAVAEKFGEGGEKGRVVVRTRATDAELQIEVEDNGAGVPAEIRDRLFDPFFTTKEVGDGTGQGLSIAYDVVVNMHQGAIDVDSTEGVGTTFTVRLPLGDSAAEPEPSGVDTAAREFETAGA